MHTARPLIARILCVLSLLVLAVAVVPHHHHHDWQICLKNDVAQSGCCEHQHEAESCGHCCCNTGCIATHFHPQKPVTLTKAPQPQVQPLLGCGDIPLLTSPLNPPSPTPPGRDNPYLESLHGTYLVRAKGLRAPPVADC